MKKLLVAVLTAMAMCSYSYAQDDDDDDDAPAKVSKKSSKKNKKSGSSSNGSGTIGIGMGLTTDFDELNFKFKLNQSMELTAIFGFLKHGENEGSYKHGNKTETQKFADNFSDLAIGVGFDYYMSMALPLSIGVDFIYSSTGYGTTPRGYDCRTGIDDGEKNDVSNSDIIIDIMVGAHAEVVSNFVISGKVGFGIDMNTLTIDSTYGKEKSTIEYSHTDFGLKAGVYGTWYFL